MGSSRYDPRETAQTLIAVKLNAIANSHSAEQRRVLVTELAGMVHLAAELRLISADERRDYEERAAFAGLPSEGDRPGAG